MRLNLPPTKTNQLALKKDLAMATEGYTLLEQKREILVMELMHLVDMVKTAQSEVENRREKAYATLKRAAAMGFGAVLFEGNIDFYGKSGFVHARDFGIRYHDLPEGADDSFFLCRELIPGYLRGVKGVYRTPQGYYVDEADVERFDETFPRKEKLRLPGQIF